VARYKRGTKGKRTDGRGIEGEHRGNAQVAAVKRGTVRWDTYIRPRYKGNRGEQRGHVQMAAVVSSHAVREPLHTPVVHER
jgi:hypothetical protein